MHGSQGTSTSTKQFWSHLLEINVIFFNLLCHAVKYFRIFSVDVMWYASWTEYIWYIIKMKRIYIVYRNIIWIHNNHKSWYRCTSRVICLLPRFHRVRRAYKSEDMDTRGVIRLPTARSESLPYIYASYHPENTASMVGNMLNGNGAHTWLCRKT